MNYYLIDTSPKPRAEHAEGCIEYWSSRPCASGCMVHITSLARSISYDWDEIEIAKRATDETLWFRAGSGCSCSSISDEEWQRLNTIDDILPAIKNWNRDWDYDSPTERISKMIERAEFRLEVSKVLSEATK